MKRLTMALAAASLLAAAPATAIAATPTDLTRADTMMNNAHNLTDSNTGGGWLLGLLAAAAVIAGIIIAVDGRDTSPTSP